MSTWLLAGASGYLGKALRVRLAVDGHQVVRLVRRDPATATERRWDPAAGVLDPSVLDGVDVVVNLAGAGVFTRPWTAERRKLLLSSRMETTGTLVRALAARAGDGHPRVLLQTSGIARYGTEPRTEPATEDTPAAGDFLAQLTARWEDAARPAADAGVRTVFLRTSPVLDRSGGAFQPMRLAWSAGLGAVLGSGQQRMPMVSLDDYLGVVVWAAATGFAEGPYNLTLPEPTTNAAFTDTLARALHRPRVLKVPAVVLRTALGELAEQVVGDCWAVPQRLTRDGYVFADPDVRAVVGSALRT